MQFSDIITNKAKSGELTESEIDVFAKGMATRSVPAEQISALCMAIMLNGMTEQETAHLAMALANSGSVLDWTTLDIDGPIADKHSTGGVGDKVSLMLAPILAACGCYVPMISGRGLGHTGGTLDKLDAIPGYNTMPAVDAFKTMVADVGCAIVGQSAQLAPAEGRLYAIRDTTATIESIPLISASILAKKFAAGVSVLVMDIKTGNGAFMESLDDSRALSLAMITGGAKIGLQTSAVISDMSQVLGSSAGNAVEVNEAVRYLRNESREARLDEVVKANCSQLLIATGLQTDATSAVKCVEDTISSGRAAEKFARMVSASGGPNDFIDRPEEYLPEARIIAPVYARDFGYVDAVDVRAIGKTIVGMGGGRQALDSVLDYSVGLTEVVSIGDRIESDTPLSIVHASDQDSFNNAANQIQRAFKMTDRECSAPELIREIIPSA